MVILPNLYLRSAIKSEIACIAPLRDDRVQELAKPKSNLGEFLSRFTNAFGRQVEPSVILYRGDAPQAYRRPEAIAGLRDILTVSAVPLNRALQLNQGAARYFVWSNFFSIYPWMVANDDSGLTAYTPAIAAFDDVESFHGQSSPEIFVQPCDDIDFDRPLRVALLEKWKSRFATNQPAHRDITLFRALNMASPASSVPSSQDVTYYDVGRQIALWISAFEILSHTGENGRAKSWDGLRPSQICAVALGQAAEEEHDCYNDRGAAIRGINGCWLYGRLYQERNNFLHGNPVTADNLKLPSGRNLFRVRGPAISHGGCRPSASNF